MNYKNRVNKLREHMLQNGIDVSIVLNPSTQYYFTGFLTVTYSRVIATVIEKDAVSIILPGLEEEFAKSLHASIDNVYAYYEDPHNANKGLTFMDHLTPILKKYTNGCLGVEHNTIPISLGETYKGLAFQLKDITDFIKTMRMIKEPEEIKMIKNAAKFAVNGLDETITSSKVGMSELEISQKGNNLVYKKVAEKFPHAILDMLVMAPTGIERTYLPHVITNTKKISNGDIVLHSRMVSLNGYHSACQRTYFVGTPTSKQKDIYDILLESFLATLDYIKPGVLAKDVDRVGRSIIEKAGLGECFNHRIGVGIGLDPLEDPYLRFDNDLELKEDMVVCIMPGVYVKDLGGFRICDTLILKEQGNYQNITPYTYDLKILNR
ncbi:M24 family metallopeptidase [Alkaliphilus peptidifermentans]|uniref:Xaa-Pro dipeptidase n=1 Tax=Alkaliphilus peptidifermentans DSM 18978 TaxID=1120976 RepID=A0A1G5L1N3_9FIRM|nr:Xaa-Pro peptidase family protein [Alkaliphilus peptidifermentans]SCZ06288.1 Xaa-Pro dipeptidase [Alkaliphilus peptidifermentans DSM 18978]